MKKSRKALAAALCAVMAASALTACGGSSSSSTAQTTAAAEEKTTAAAVETTAAAAETTAAETEGAAAEETTAAAEAEEGQTEAPAEAAPVNENLAAELDESKKVTGIDIGSLPTKTTYVIGEEFSMDGGTIVVTYDDGTTAELAMSNSAFTVKEPGLSASGTKTVTIKCGKKSARFTVEVANKSFHVTYNLNYDGAPEAESVEVVKGQKTEELAAERDGYTLYGWYIDPDFTETFDFKTEITEDIELYALWEKDGADYADVTFDYNYYGAKLSSYSYPVEVGTAVSRPQADPERTGYTFAEWVDEDGNAYDFSSEISGPVTIKATWTKAVTGSQSYIFEAEDTDLSGKTGPAISGTANEIGMILVNETAGASNDRSVGYLYQYGNSLEFYIACDETVTDAVLSVSLSAEMEDLTLTPDTFGIYLNGEKLSYDQIDITDVPEYDSTTYVAEPAPYQYYIIGSGLTLQAGANEIRLVTENSESYPGTTMVAHAPLVDAVKIDTEGVVTWDENKGVPADNY